MPNSLARSEQTTHVNPLERTLTLSRQSDLLADLIRITFPADTPTKLSVQELAYQLDALRNDAQGIAQESCADLLRVSAGLGSVLRLLDYDSDEVEDSHGLHCLLTPLKQQLDAALNRVQGLL
ncbi:hypothetical protein CF70_026615 [Cupriavidus sp. SK-3]|uniref:DUF1484 family protein n=1 Tax=Cupriavidus TaxID=106589 RepID=UPI000452013A|nr:MULTISPECIES: DUF1484 family protein [Cupriavidus]KDP83244.1 hypothetical protein CF70_026615 [Cupriavidus sp. SK-3]MDF3887013.1 DUF1484 family protein [Cupriavidus basilensis]